MKNQTGNALLGISLGFFVLCGLILAYSAFDDYQSKQELQEKQAVAELERRAKNAKKQQQQVSATRESHQTLSKFDSRIVSVTENDQNKEKIQDLRKIQAELYDLSVAECLQPAKQNLIKYIDYRINFEQGSASATGVQLDADKANAQAQAFRDTMRKCRDGW